MAAKQKDDCDMVYETCLVQNQLIQIPRFLVENERLFLSLMSMETWNALSAEAKEELTKLLPEESDIGKNEIVRRLLTKRNFHFGNPVRKMFRLLHEGSFHPDVAAFATLCRRAKYKDYLLRQKDHFSQLVFDILPSRQIVLDVASLLPEGVPLRIKPPLSSYSDDPRHRRDDESATSKRRVLTRAGLEYYRALAEVRQDVADDGETSSEDEAFPDEAPLFLKAKGFSSSDPAALDFRVASVGNVGDGRRREESANDEDGSRGNADTTKFFRVMDTLAPELDPVSNDEYDAAAARNTASNSTPLTPALTEERYETMLKRHKRRKKSNSTAKGFRPDLNTEGIEINDVIRRTEMSMVAGDDDGDDELT